jgi:hypothetical protein
MMRALLVIVKIPGDHPPNLILEARCLVIAQMFSDPDIPEAAFCGVPIESGVPSIVRFCWCITCHMIVCCWLQGIDARFAAYAVRYAYTCVLRKCRGVWVYV